MIDREMKGQVDNVAQIFFSLSFQDFFTDTERQADGLSWKRKLTPPSVDDLRMLLSFVLNESIGLWRHIDNPIARASCKPKHMEWR